MKIFFQVLGAFLLALILTVLTQVGALVVLLWWPLGRFLRKKVAAGWKGIAIRTVAFICWWSVFSLLIIPLLAPLNGRVALPIWGNENLKAFQIGYAFLNRHYVRPPLKILLEESAIQLNEKYPGSVIAYLDANFPFINSFPLLPHLSHNDGKKVDVAFFFRDSKSKEYLPRKALSIIAYGGCVMPDAGEFDQAAVCARQGYRQYSRLQQIMPQINGREFDQARTREMLRIFSRHPNTGKLLLEPHLKTRLQLNYDNIRFHGCQAVRHDDHVHIQL